MGSQVAKLLSPLEEGPASSGNLLCLSKYSVAHNPKGSMVPAQSVKYCTACSWSGFTESCKSQSFAWPPVTPRLAVLQLSSAQGHFAGHVWAAPACQHTQHCLLVPICRGRWPPAGQLWGPCSSSSQLVRYRELLLLLQSQLLVQGKIAFCVWWGYFFFRLFLFWVFFCLVVNLCFPGSSPCWREEQL